MAVLLGILTGGWLLPGIARVTALPEPIPEGVQSRRFGIANPTSGKVTAYDT